MKLARRDWLKFGALAGASLLSGLGKAAGAPGPSQADSERQRQAWGNGFDPGQTLPAEATSGPWRELRAVKEKKVFDAHCHCWGTPPGHNEPVDNSDALIAAMDLQGIAQAALAPSRMPYDTVAANDVVPHLDRFIRVTGYPTKAVQGKQPTPDLVAEQTRIQMERDGCKLIGETTGDALMGLQARYSVSELKPIVDVARAYSVPVQVHTGWVPGAPHRKPGQDPREYLQIAARVARSWPDYMEALLAEYPDVKFILAHTGGPLAIPDGYEALRLLFSYSNAYVDTSTSPLEIIVQAVKGVGAERVMFASDWNQPALLDYGPFHLRAVYQQWWNLNNIANADFTEDQKDWILYKSARKLLKLPEA